MASNGIAKDKHIYIIKELQEDVANYAENKQFYSPHTIEPEEPHKFVSSSDWAISKLGLIHTELSELEVELRKAKYSEHDNLGYVAEEAADMIIRILNLYHSLGYEYNSDFEAIIVTELVVGPQTLEEVTEDLYQYVSMIRKYVDLTIEAVRKQNEAALIYQFRMIMAKMISLIEACNINYEHAIGKKMAVNHQRPVKHGKVA